MKEILVILLCVMCVLVVGCQKNDNEVTNGNVSGELENKGSGENLIIDNSDTEELALQEKYKLSDDDTLKYEMKKDTVYNVAYTWEGKIVRKDQKINVAGKEHTVSVADDCFTMIDDKKITSVIGDANYEQRMKWINNYVNVGTLYIEERPYIVMRFSEGEIAGDILYSITDKLELKFEESFEELYKIGDKYIAPEFFKEHDLDHYADGIVIGYWYCENGEWKRINRSINGKVYVDDEGNLSDEVSIVSEGEMGPALNRDYFSVENAENGTVLATNSKFKFKKIYKDLDRTFDIEMLEDSTWGTKMEWDEIEDKIQIVGDGKWIIPVGNEEIIPKGTIIKVKIY